MSLEQHEESYDATTRNRAMLWRRHQVQQSIKPCLLLWAALILFPASLSFYHFHNWLSFHQCLLIKYELHVDLYCAGPRNSFGSGQLRRRIERLPSSVVELSEALVGWDTAPLEPFSDEKSVAVWDGMMWKVDGQDIMGVSSFAPVSTGNELSSSRTIKSSYTGRRRQPKTVATGMLWTINVVMFLWLWNSRIDPSRVALSSQIYDDFGRAISGNLAHFDLWHIGFNMMSLSSLGSMLEHNVISSMSLLLYTLSFLPVTTLVVIGLHRIRQRSFQRWHDAGDGSDRLPSMVGFSGILFAWMVVSALEGSRSCPIFFLPDLCFDTFNIWGNFRVSVGPLVQLVVLQVILPRVSFLGHLAGILVGFVWHWNLLPPLEWFQPSILYPLVWTLLKLIRWRQSSHIESERMGSSIFQQTFHTKKMTLLKWIRIAMCFHGFFALMQVRTVSSFLVVQILQIALLSLSIHYGSNSISMQKFDMISRANLFMITVWLSTDGLLFGGLLVTRHAWQYIEGLALLTIARSFMLTMLFFVYSYHQNDTVLGVGDSGGTWSLFLWPTVNRCQPAGKLLVELVPSIHQDASDEETTEFVTPRLSEVSSIL